MFMQGLNLYLFVYFSSFTLYITLRHMMQYSAASLAPQGCESMMSPHMMLRRFENFLYDSTDSGLSWIILAYFFV